MPSRLVEWTRATGATRTVVADLGGSDLVGVSSDGRLALLTGDDEAAVARHHDRRGPRRRATRGRGRLSGDVERVRRREVARDPRIRQRPGHGRGGDRVDVVQDGEAGGPRGPRHNPGAATRRPARTAWSPPRPATCGSSTWRRAPARPPSSHARAAKARSRAERRRLAAGVRQRRERPAPRHPPRRCRRYVWAGPR